jgi:hypothetical protein
MNDKVYVIVFLLASIASLLLAARIARPVMYKAWWKPLGIFGLIAGMGITAGVHWPLRQARVIVDTNLLAHGPFQTRYIRGTGPESPIVWLAITNATGQYAYLEIERDTREVTFSRVSVREEIQF